GVLLGDVWGTLSGAKGKPLTPSAQDSLWADLASLDGARAFRATRALLRTPDRGVGLLRTRLRPLPAASSRQIARLLSALDADDFQTREEPTWRLERMGEATAPDLRQALAARPSLEVRRRLERLLRYIDRQAPGPDDLRAARAVGLLEHGGTEEGLRHLQVLARGVPLA